MSKFNEHVLLVMRWLQNNNSVNRKELETSYIIAADAVYAATKDAATKDASDTAIKTAHAASSAYRTAKNAALTAYNDAYNADATANVEYWLSETEKSLNEYFEITKEDRKAYERQVKHLSILGAKNG